MIPRDTTQRIKGAAIVFVILSHLPRIISFPAYISSMLHPFGYLGVGLFLCLSGYGCAVSVARGGYNRRFIIRRIQTIVPALAVCTVAVSLLYLMLFGERFPIWEVGLNAVGLSCSIGHVTWYVCFQYICYLILFIGGVKKRSSTSAIYFAMGIAVIVFSAAFEIDSIGLSMWGLNAFSFPAGVLWYIHKDEMESSICKRRKIIIVGLSVAFVLLFVLCYFVLGNPENRFIQNPLKSLIALIMCLVFLTVGSCYQKIFDRADVCNLLSGIGSISYELFLAHGFILFTIIPRLEIPKGLKFIIFVAGTAVGTVLLYCVNKAGKRLYRRTA